VQLHAFNHDTRRDVGGELAIAVKQHQLVDASALQFR
jgi:hypothetical protein